MDAITSVCATALKADEDGDVGTTPFWILTTAIEASLQILKLLVKYEINLLYWQIQLEVS